jgi:hypothetical protein
VIGRFALTDGNNCNRIVSSRIYSQDAIHAARAAFLEHCAVQVEPAGDGLLKVIVAPVGEAIAAPREAILAFWNFVLDSEAQSRIGS